MKVKTCAARSARGARSAAHNQMNVHTQTRRSRTDTWAVVTHTKIITKKLPAGKCRKQSVKFYAFQSITDRRSQITDLTVHCE